MNVRMIRAEVKPEHVADVEAAAEKLFAALAEAQPHGLHYTSTKLADGVTFVALVGVDDGVENPLPGIPAYVEMTSALPDWYAAPPQFEELTVLGSYDLF